MFCKRVSIDELLLDGKGFQSLTNS